MYSRLVVSFCLGLNFASAALAQQPRNRIDLSVSEGTPLAEGVASPAAISGIAFRPADAVWPEEHGTVEIRSGQMFLSRLNSKNQAKPSKLPGNDPAGLLHNKPLDDETYQYEIGNEECRLLLHVRLQTQRDGGWQPAILPYWSRPSVPKEERSALMRGMLDFMKERRESGKSEAQSQPPQPPRVQLLGDVSALGEAFFFEGPSNATFADCFQAVGTYEVSQEGVFFTFLRALPGNLNRFAIERNDINSYQGRLYFVHGGCRFQFTASGSRKYNSEWAPLMIDNPI
jgi:hypothetical protein